MSLLIAHLQPDRALVAVDTACRFIDGSYGHTTKLYSVPHIGAVIAARGAAGFLVSMVIGAVGVAQSFEQAREGVERGFAELLAMFQRMASEQGSAAQMVIDGRQELLLVGWSQNLGRMAAATFCKAAGESLLVVDDLDAGDCIFAPGDMPDWMPDPDTADHAISAARYQVENWQGAAAGDPVGGDLIVAQMARNSITITRHHAFAGAI
ncbi:hypothetical protein [Pseudaquabacterium pictum]|nr:hypothetical protein [Rubrivivax pictus]